MKALIGIRGLLIQRGGHDSLRIASLDILRGETLAVVGPNGAGKSTLLLALAHLLKPAHGEIRFEGRPLASWDELEYRRRIAIVLQEPLLTDMTVEQNVGLGLRFRGVDRDQVRARVRKWLKLLGIEQVAKRRAVRLSGGEAQRVSLARALVLEPELLLLDEPFSSLDPPSRAKLLDDLSGLLAADHRTTVFVTHDLKEAARLGNRVAVIVEGRLRQVGPARQIKSDPADRAVAAFVEELQP